MPSTSDIKRLRAELQVMWRAVLEEVTRENPRMNARDRKEAARSRFISNVDEVVREVVAAD